LGGTGTWTGSTNFSVNQFSNLTLLNNVTFDGTNLILDGTINTGASTLSLPCNVNWFFNLFAGDVIGNVRRTNLGACPGGTFAFGNSFTTVQFTSGTPPTALDFSVALSPPPVFPSAVRRTYTITPTGGSNYTATLRLHYLDSELNGNAEATLQLWRRGALGWTAQGATNRNTTQNWVEYAGVTQFSPWALSGPLAPTAAFVNVSGRVSTASGQGIRNATVTITDESGASRTAATSSFGYFSFDEVRAGQTYVISVTSGRFTFANPTVILPVSNDVSDIEFVADPAP
jgi:hypothetical protein